METATDPQWQPPTLSGRVAVVTGASRGVGKGIALALGECDATVYVTGRSTRERAGSGRGTIEDTADEVSARRGRGVPVATDHADERQAFAAEGRQPPDLTHSPEYVGRAIAHLLADPEVLELSGSGAQAAVYATRYGFRDVDGRRIEPFVMPDEYRL